MEQAIGVFATEAGASLLDLAGGRLFALESFEANLLTLLIGDVAALTIGAMKTACAAEQHH